VRDRLIDRARNLVFTGTLSEIPNAKAELENE
jgi:hypothetical protein